MKPRAVFMAGFVAASTLCARAAWAQQEGSTRGPRFGPLAVVRDYDAAGTGAGVVIIRTPLDIVRDYDEASMRGAETTLVVAPWDGVPAAASRTPTPARGAVARLPLVAYDGSEIYGHDPTVQTLRVITRYDADPRATDDSHVAVTYDAHGHVLAIETALPALSLASSSPPPASSATSAPRPSPGRAVIPRDHGATSPRGREHRVRVPGG